MAGFASYEVDPGGDFGKALDRAKGIADDLRIPFSLIANDFYRSNKSLWTQSGAGVYQDLSEQYKPKKKAKVGFIYPILRLNGYLEAAATEQGATGNVTEIGEQSFSIGVDEGTIPYAGYHNSDGARSKMPLRKFIFIGPEAPKFVTSEIEGRLERWIGILNEFMEEKLKKSGLGEVK